MNGVVTEGEVLAGKYRIERIIGQGGMGVVLSAIHLQLHQRVAIKLLTAEANKETVKRFRREAQAAFGLKSEHVARVIDIGVLETGAPYMVMEYLEGSDLSQVLRQRGPLALEEAVEYVLHACEGIAEAHAAGIVHRDLKPANLFLTSAADGTPTVKVLDFGIISKPSTSEPPSSGAEPEMALTRTAMVLGSPLYMSPEQMRSARTVDARADIWSLGAILYQLLTGRVPFETTSLAELILMINGERPPPPAFFRPDLPPAMEAAILRCLEKNREDRFATIAELAEAIAPFGPLDAQGSVAKIRRMLGVVATSPRGAPSRAASSVPGALSAPGAARPSTPGSSQGGRLSSTPGSSQGGRLSAPGAVEPPRSPLPDGPGAVGPFEITRSSSPGLPPVGAAEASQASLPGISGLSVVVARTAQSAGEPQARSGSNPGAAPTSPGWAASPAEKVRPRGGRKAVAGVAAALLLIGATVGAAFQLRSPPPAASPVAAATLAPAPELPPAPTA